MENESTTINYSGGANFVFCALAPLVFLGGLFFAIFGAIGMSSLPLGLVL